MMTILFKTIIQPMSPLKRLAQKPVTLAVCAIFSTALLLSPSHAAQTVDRIVAVVDDTPILQSDVAAAMKTAKLALQKTNMPLPPERTLEAQVLDRLITRTTQLNLIKRLGSRINNEAVNEALLRIAAKRGISSLSEFQLMLEEKQAGSYAALRQQIREEMTIQQLRQQELRNRVKISEQDINYFLLSPESQRLHKTEYRTNHIRISLPENQATTAQRNEALRLGATVKQMYAAGDDIDTIVARLRRQTNLPVQGGDMGFHPQNALPPHLRHHIIRLGVGQTTSPVAHIDGVHIVNLADKKDASESIVHQWKVRHILIKPNEVMNLDQAKHNIDELYEQLRRGTDFATLASTYSDDPGSARKGGSLDWVGTGQMVPEFDAMMQRTAAGDFSVPFQTQFGWHILKVEAERDKNMSDAFKRNVARETLFKRMSTQAIEDWMQELRADSYIKIFDERFKSS